MKCEMKRDLRREMKCEMERGDGLPERSCPGRHRNTGTEVPRKLERRPTDTALADPLIKPGSLCRTLLLIMFAHVLVPRSQKTAAKPPESGVGGEMRPLGPPSEAGRALKGPARV